MALSEVRSKTGLGVQALPTGTQLGDAIMVVTSADDGGAIVQGGDQFHTTIAVSDMGVTVNGGKFFLGVVNSLNPIEITTSGSTSGVRSKHGLILTFTGEFNMDRLTMGSYMGARTAVAVAMPALPESGDGAILAAAGWAGIGGSQFDGASGGGATWNSPASMHDGVYHSVGASWTDAETVGSATLNGTYERVGAILVGVGVPPTVAPPCRLFPRDDSLGVGSGRHFPPPKSQQRSGRRFGYY